MFFILIEAHFPDSLSHLGPESEVSAVVIRLLVSVMHYEHVNAREGAGGVEHRSQRCFDF